MAAAVDAGAPPPAASTTATIEPFFTLSPIFTFSSLTTPACVDGISIDALSLSTVIRDCSDFTVSPGFTRSSMISTSLKSPMSGTLTSTNAILLSPRFLSGVQRVDLVGVDAVLLDRFCDLRCRQCALFCQGLQRRDGDVVAVDLEVLAQLASEVAATEAVGAQHLVDAAARNEGADLLGVVLHVVGGSDDRADVGLQLLGHEGHTRPLGRMQQIPAFRVLPVAGQFVEARAAPDVGRHAPILFEQFLGGNALAQNRARAQEVHARRFLGAFFEQVHAFDD